MESLVGPEENVAHGFQRSQDGGETLNLRATGRMDGAGKDPSLVTNLPGDLRHGAIFEQRHGDAVVQ